MGRTKLFKDGKEQIGVYLTPEEAKALDEIRWRERKGRTEVGREAILEYIRLHAEGNDTFKLDSWNLNPNTQAIPNMFAEDSKIKSDYLTSSKEERQRRFKNIQRIIQLYKDVNYEESK